MQQQIATWLRAELRKIVQGKEKKKLNEGQQAESFEIWNVAGIKGIRANANFNEL